MITLADENYNKKKLLAKLEDYPNEALSTPNASLKAIPRTLSEMGLGMPTIGGSLVEKAKTKIPDIINTLNGNPTVKTNSTPSEPITLSNNLPPTTSLAVPEKLSSLGMVQQGEGKWTKSTADGTSGGYTSNNNQYSPESPEIQKIADNAINPSPRTTIIGASQNVIESQPMTLLGNGIGRSQAELSKTLFTNNSDGMQAISRPVRSQDNVTNTLENRDINQPVRYLNAGLNVDFPSGTPLAEIKAFTNTHRGLAEQKAIDDKIATTKATVLQSLNGGRGPVPEMPIQPNISGMAPREAATLMDAYKAKIASRDNWLQNATQGKNYDAQNANQATQNSINAKHYATNDANSAEQNRITEENNKSTNLRSMANTDSEIAYRNAQIDSMKNPVPKPHDYKPQVVKNKDILGNESEIVMIPVVNKDGKVSYVNGMGNQPSQQNQLAENHPAIEFLRKNPSRANSFKAKYGYLPSWALTK